MGDVTVTCRGPCGQTVYDGDGTDGQGHLIDGQQLLISFAVNHPCPAGGDAGGCPNTPAAIEEQAERQPARLRMLVKALRDRKSRGVTVPVPALTASTPVEVPVTWTPELPDGTYQVTWSAIHGPALLGRINVAIKPGSKDKAGCVLIVGSAVAVGAGLAGLDVVANP